MLEWDSWDEDNHEVDWDSWDEHYYGRNPSYPSEYDIELPYEYINDR